MAALFKVNKDSSSNPNMSKYTTVGYIARDVSDMYPKLYCGANSGNTFQNYHVVMSSTEFMLQLMQNYFKTA